MLIQEGLFPFVNRQNELSEILDNSAPPYYLIAAPSGYGKTRFVKALKEKFEKQDYICGYVSFKEAKTYLDVLQALAKDLFGDTLLIDEDAFVQPLPGKPMAAGIKLELDQNQADSWGYRFQDALRRLGKFELPESETDNGRKAGIALMFDDVDNGSLPLPQVEILLKYFIPSLQRNLAVLKFFTNKGRFRVIVAGRYISTKAEVKRSLTFATMTLKPFTLNVITQAVQNVLPEVNSQEQEQISAHLMYLTGGHPECIKKVLDFNRTDGGGNAEEFIRFKSDEIWNNIVLAEVEEIRAGIPKRLLKTFEYLSIYRVFNVSILNNLLENNKIKYKKGGDVHGLGDELTGTHLYSREKRIIKDAITRRLILLNVFHNSTPVAFKARSETAFEIYKKLLQDPKVSTGRELWAVECLYQALQMDVFEINTLEKRHQKAQEFMNEVVREVRNLYLSNIQDDEPDLIEDEIGVLLEVLNEDWEFEFVLNYFLRDKLYSDAPYQQLIKLLKG